MNTYDQVVLAAVAGVEPDDDDLDRVAVPPGDDPNTFRSELASKATEIAELHRDGENGQAHKLAAEAAAIYAAAFPTPTAAVTLSEGVDDIAARMFRS